MIENGFSSPATPWLKYYPIFIYYAKQYYYYCFVGDIVIVTIRFYLGQLSEELDIIQ